MKIGICTKCGQTRKVVMHHAHGYEDEHKDDVLPYCPSCHRNIHIKARISGKCQISPDELNRLSIKSSKRRNNHTIRVGDDTIIPNVCLREIVQYNISTHNLRCNTHFIASNGKKLYFVYIW